MIDPSKLPDFGVWVEVDKPCPACGRVTVRIKRTLTVVPNASLAGTWPKVSAEEVWHMECTNIECGVSGLGSRG